MPTMTSPRRRTLSAPTLVFPDRLSALSRCSGIASSDCSSKVRRAHLIRRSPRRICWTGPRSARPPKRHLATLNSLTPTRRVIQLASTNCDYHERPLGHGHMTTRLNLLAIGLALVAAMDAPRSALIASPAACGDAFLAASDNGT